jgi:hypothetical protein
VWPSPSQAASPATLHKLPPPPAHQKQRSGRGDGSALLWSPSLRKEKVGTDRLSMAVSRGRPSRLGAHRRHRSGLSTVSSLRPEGCCPPPPSFSSPVSPHLPATSDTDAAVGASSCVASSPTLPGPGLRCCSEVVGDGALDVQPPRLLLHGSWASLADVEDDSDEEELAPLTPRATNCSPLAAQPNLEREAEASRGWQEVLSRHGPRRSATPAPSSPTRPIPAWLSGRCCRCLTYGHRAAVCRDPFRCYRCLENGHCA